MAGITVNHKLDSTMLGNSSFSMVGTMVVADTMVDISVDGMVDVMGET